MGGKNEIAGEESNGRRGGETERLGWDRGGQECEETERKGKYCEEVLKGGKRGDMLQVEWSNGGIGCRGN